MSCNSQPSDIFEVTLTRHSGERLGVAVMGVAFMEATAVFVQTVREGGSVHRHNTTCSVEKRIRKGDCIVRAGQIVLDADRMMEAIKNSTEIDVTFLRRTELVCLAGVIPRPAVSLSSVPAHLIEYLSEIRGSSPAYDIPQRKYASEQVRAPPGLEVLPQRKYASEPVRSTTHNLVRAPPGLDLLAPPAMHTVQAAKFANQPGSHTTEMGMAPARNTAEVPARRHVAQQVQPQVPHSASVKLASGIPKSLEARAPVRKPQQTTNATMNEPMDLASELVKRLSKVDKGWLLQMFLDADGQVAPPAASIPKAAFVGRLPPGLCTVDGADAEGSTTAASLHSADKSDFSCEVKPIHMLVNHASNSQSANAAAKPKAKREKGGPVMVVSDGQLTTIMLRHLPSSWTRRTLEDLLNLSGYAGKYDFLYMPMNLRTGLPFGYAFVNFLTPETAEFCRAAFDGCTWDIEGGLRCIALWANTEQGFQANAERYRDSPLMHKDVPDVCRPAIFKHGQRISFPPPTTVLKAPPKLRIFDDKATKVMTLRC